ncbi:MAG: lytic transglycosylase domain-containing protein [Desulfobulbaceae bacterium]|nr:lytic transglycosylase domain-containing protein [Desulfobulbaceae bacterium]
MLPLPLWSQIYMYVDADGVRHYTNAPSSDRYKPVKLRRLNNEQGRYPLPVHHGETASGNPALYEQYIEKAAVMYKLDPLLIKAIIKVESDFNRYAVSSSGAQGLMQLMPGTARDMQVDNPFDPRQNINGGTRYFKYLLDTYENDLSRSLAAYNAGPSRVALNGPLPGIPETREYVRRVISSYRSYQQMAAAGGMDTIHKDKKLLTAN